LSVHSFTPVWRGAARPWHAAILWDRDPRLAVPLLRELRAEPTLLVGDNEPYSGQLRGDTLWQHGTCRGLAHAIVEIRQDLIEDEAGQTRWGDRLAAIMTSIIDGPMYGPPLRQPQFYGSHTGKIK
ncbi:MAG: N-formylglutamate amidohydrolase, partial [Hyphomicrobiaceae bacterium]|nr:N-formylglutamate amidohydrolase [Hyphomicrobiaceae bacterium]